MSIYALQGSNANRKLCERVANGAKLTVPCRILSETNMPVTEVCFEVGYNNISNFNRHFLAEKGVTPSQYRRMSARKFTAEASG
jgi:AraC-like DNA-binding protein